MGSTFNQMCGGEYLVSNVTVNVRVFASFGEGIHQQKVRFKENVIKMQVVQFFVFVDYFLMWCKIIHGS